jgi:hypothetical protein
MAIQTLHLHQALALPFDDGLPSMLLEGARTRMSGAKEIGMYRPGELLRMSIQDVSKTVEFEAASDVSTTDTDWLNSSASSLSLSDDLESQSQIGFESLMVTSNIALPSAGSANHDLGVCRPCGFVHKQGGCSHGVECPFCHLCLPGSIQLQRKLSKKKKLEKAAKEATQLAC